MFVRNLAVVSIASAFAAGLPVLSGAQTLWLRADDASHITLDGTNHVTSWQNQTGAQMFTSGEGQQPIYVPNAVNGLPALRFDGSNDVLRNLDFSNSTASELTMFVVVAPHSNAGSYRAFLSSVDDSTTGHQDFNSGFNLDMGNTATSAFDVVNLEGAKAGGGGGVNLRTQSDNFDTYKVLSITYGSNQQDTLYVNGVAEGSRFGNGNSMSLNDLRVGARYYDNGGGPFETGYLDGDIPELMVYDHLLTDTERMTIENTLIAKYLAPVPGPGALLTTLIGAVPGATVLLRRRRRK